eukprot:1147754-Pelagomonas_calceolata.AAC.2
MRKSCSQSLLPDCLKCTAAVLAFTGKVSHSTICNKELCKMHILKALVSWVTTKLTLIWRPTFAKSQTLLTRPPDMTTLCRTPQARLLRAAALRQRGNQVETCATMQWCQGKQAPTRASMAHRCQGKQIWDRVPHGQRERTLQGQEKEQLTC